MSGIWGLIAGIGVPSIVLVVGFLLRHGLAEFITAGIKHSFEQEIERLRADLQQKAEEIRALREGALANLSNRRALLATRKLQAVDQLWASVVTLSKLNAAPMYVAILNLENINKRIEADKKLQTFFQLLSSGHDLEKVNSGGAERQRPFITLRAWALFSAYRIIIVSAVGRLKLLATGIDTKDMFDNAKVSQLLKAALPDQTAYVDKHGLQGGYHLLEGLEDAILGELNDILDGKEDDQKTIRNAKHILDAVSKMH